MGQENSNPTAPRFLFQGALAGGPEQQKNTTQQSNEYVFVGL